MVSVPRTGLKPWQLAVLFLVAGAIGWLLAVRVSGVWGAVVHGSGSDYTGRYGHVVPYSFWSGVAGSFLVNVLAFFTLWYLHHTCHGSPWCWRFGKYEAAGGVFKLCRHHHPDLRGERPHAGLIEKLHREHQERSSCGCGGESV